MSLSVGSRKVPLLGPRVVIPATRKWGWPTALAIITSVGSHNCAGLDRPRTQKNIATCGDVGTVGLSTPVLAILALNSTHM